VADQCPVCRGEREPRRDVFGIGAFVHARSVTSTTDKMARAGRQAGGSTAEPDSDQIRCPG
jgi:hypothetical protein